MTCPILCISQGPDINSNWCSKTSSLLPVQVRACLHTHLGTKFSISETFRLRNCRYRIADSNSYHLLSFYYVPLLDSWACLVAQQVKNLPAMHETWARSLGWEDPLEKGKGYPLQYPGLENSMACIAHGVAKRQTQLSKFHFHYVPGNRHVLPSFNVSNDKESACNAGDSVLIPGSGRTPKEGNGYSLQYSCLENPMDRGAWQASIHWVANNCTQMSD